MSETATSTPLLEVTDLSMRFPVGRSAGRSAGRGRAYLNAVDGISLQIDRGSSLGLVGESGCGKSTTARSIARLYEPTGGSIRLMGQDIAHLSGKPLLDVREHVQMIFQDPYSSLNPRHTVGTIVSTPLVTHARVSRSELTRTVQDLLKTVGLSSEHYNRYPNEFSGGQRQRIGIARALALKPDLIVADEPVSALDVSIRAQIINLLRKLQDDFGVAFLFIAHDLMMVRHFCPQIAVMYLGKIVEYGSRDSIYQSPHHPYTQALLSAVPDLNQASGRRRERIRLSGDVPSPVDPPSGCRFRTRCWKAQERCAVEEPTLRTVGGRQVACHFADYPG